MATVPSMRGQQASGAAVSSGIINDAGTLGSWLSGQNTPATANRPYAQLRQATAQSIPNSANTALVWDTIDYDNVAGAANGSANYTVQYAGVYEVEGDLHWSGNATGARYAQIAKNNAQVGTANGWQVVPNGGVFTIHVRTLIRCVVGDTLTLIAYQNSGGALSTYTGGQGFYSQMHVTWLAA